MTHTDGLPMDYQDDKDRWHIMAACGHRVIGPKPGTPVTLCPNCSWLMVFKSEGITLMYPDRMEDRHR